MEGERRVPGVGMLDIDKASMYAHNNNIDNK